MCDRLCRSNYSTTSGGATLQKSPCTEEVNDVYRRADDDVCSVILTSEFDRTFSPGMELDMMAGGSGLDLRRFLETLYFEMLSVFS